MSRPDVTSPRDGLATAMRRRASLREAAIVLGLPVTLFLASSLAWHARAKPVALTDARLLATLGVELGVTALVLPFLLRRGWRPAVVAGAPAPMDVLRGIGVWLAAMSAVYVVFVALQVAAPALAESLRTPRFGGAPSPAVVVGVALLNPVFEEFLWLGYAVPALGSRFGLRASCIVSVTLRVAVHLYQGPMVLVGVLPLTAVLTWYFARSGRLWPVVVAHVIADAAALGALSTAR